MKKLIKSMLATTLIVVALAATSMGSLNAQTVEVEEDLRLFQDTYYYLGPILIARVTLCDNPGDDCISVIVTD